MKETRGKEGRERSRGKKSGGEIGEESERNTGKE